MLTRVGKVLTCAIAILSVGFLAATLSVLRAGTDWRAVASDIEGYSFNYTEGETPTWTAVRDVDGETVKTSPVLADVIAAVYDALAAESTAKADELAQRRGALQSRLEMLESTRVVDEKLLDVRITQLQEQVNDLRTQTVRTLEQVGARAEEVAELERVVSARRDDVFRVQAQLGAAAADQARVEQVRRQLADLIAQIDADLGKTRRREAQLQTQLGGAGGPAPATAPAAPNFPQL